MPVTAPPDRLERLAGATANRNKGIWQKLFTLGTYHPHWNDFLTEGKSDYFVLGCMDREVAHEVPRDVLQPELDALNTTTKPGGDLYWHIHLVETTEGIALLRIFARTASKAS